MLWICYPELSHWEVNIIFIPMLITYTWPTGTYTASREMAPTRLCQDIIGACQVSASPILFAFSKNIHSLYKPLTQLFAPHPLPPYHNPQSPITPQPLQPNPNPHRHPCPLTLPPTLTAMRSASCPKLGTPRNRKVRPGKMTNALCNLCVPCVQRSRRLLWFRWHVLYNVQMALTAERNKRRRYPQSNRRV